MDVDYEFQSHTHYSHNKHRHTQAHTDTHQIKGHDHESCALLAPYSHFVYLLVAALLLT